MTTGGKVAFAIALTTAAGGLLARSWLVTAAFLFAAVMVAIEDGLIDELRKRRDG